MTPALSVQNLCKSFGEFALQDITFDVPCGVVTAIIGETPVCFAQSINSSRPN